MMLPEVTFESSLIDNGSLASEYKTYKYGMSVRLYIP